MVQPNSAVAPALPPADIGGGIAVTSVALRGDVERVEVSVTLPASFQYVIPSRKKVNGQWVDDVANSKVGITADGYDYLNRTLGVSFWLPDYVPDEHGELVRNPIHRPDYLYIRMGAVWYNEAGQLVGMTEDLEVDYKQVYLSNRLEARDSEVVLDEVGQPVFDDNGNPMVRLTEAGSEKRAMKSLLQLRTMGLRYAQTVLRIRLIKAAIGVKSLPGGEVRSRTVRVVGFRDKMDPVARAASAEKAMTAMFGGKPQPRPTEASVPPDVLFSIEAPDAEEQAESAADAAMGLVEPPDEEFSLR
jgi:hypothetical protein